LYDICFLLLRNVKQGIPRVWNNIHVSAARSLSIILLLFIEQFFVIIRYTL
jgi:hypothetical protein